jgi:DNA-binding beta-propeller fold protein YncE
MNSTALKIDTSAPARPRFVRDPAAQIFRLPPGRKIGGTLAADYGPDRHLWLLTQPGPGEEFLPSVVEFDETGAFVAAWGGPDHIPTVDGRSQWPSGVEGLEVDADSNVWVFGYQAEDHAVLRFSRDGTLLLRIGERGVPGDDSSRTHLNRPTTCYHDVEAREVFVSDGYGNHRIVAFNSDTGAFTRMWGAFGRDPVGQPAEEAFGNPVHKVACAPDGLLYVADRIKNRVQEFERCEGGARFLREVVIAPGTWGFGSAFDIAFSPDGAFMYVSDGTNNRVWIIDRGSLQVLGWTGSYCEAEGDANAPAFYGLIHRVLTDPDGNILLVRPGKGLELLRWSNPPA